MATCDIDAITGEVIENSPAPLKQRVSLNGVLITKADVTSIDWKAWDTADLTTEIASGTLTNDAIYDALQLNGWYADSLGFNFEHIAAGSIFAGGGTTVRIEHTVNLTSGATFGLRRFELWVIDHATDGD